jgi:hypothetical protein
MARWKRDEVANRVDSGIPDYNFERAADQTRTIIDGAKIPLWH